MIYTISGTMVAGIVGLSRYETPTSIYAKIKGGKEPIDNAAVNVGLKLESTILSIIESQYDLKLRQQVFLTHPIHPFTGHVDGLDKDKGVIVECKTTKQKIEDNVPLEYFTQAQWYLMLCNDIYSERFNKTIIPVYQYQMDPERMEKIIDKYGANSLLDFGDLRVWEVESDEAFQIRCVNKVLEFIECLKNDIIPDPDEATVADLTKIYKSKLGSTIEADEKLMNLLEQYLNYSEQIKSLEKQQEEIKKEIFLIVKDNEYIIDQNAVVLASWKSYEEEYFDTQAFAKQNPEIYSRFLKKRWRKRFHVKYPG